MWPSGSTAVECDRVDGMLDPASPARDVLELYCARRARPPPRGGPLLASTYIMVSTVATGLADGRRAVGARFQQSLSKGV